MFSLGNEGIVRRKWMHELGTETTEKELLHEARVLPLGLARVLGDVAPTVLELLGLEQPAVMTGRSLLAPA